MIRVLLVAALTVALAGVAFAAVDAGRVDRTATRMDAAADRLARTAGHLLDRDDPTARDVPGARRTVTVALPERSLDVAPVDAFAVNGSDGPAGPGGWVRYRVDGATRRVRIPADLRTPDGPVVLRGSGRRRLRLELVRGDPPGVLVRRANATS